jgi:murein DD-endopeptidase MepM/ murein hydrolase activator NlpD
LFERVRDNAVRRAKAVGKRAWALHAASKRVRSLRIERIAPLGTDPFDDDDQHRRWLLTTCIAGAAGAFIVGGAMLGLFGDHPAANVAYASVDSEAGQLSHTGSLKLYQDESVSGEAQALVVAERDLNGVAYPEISTTALPYGNGKTVVIESEMSVGALATENITTIAKTPPPEPVDESFKLAKRETLIDALTERGVTTETAQALVAAIEPVFPARMIKAGTEFELTLDRQQDFYGRNAIFPVQLTFRPGPKESITVEADEDGNFVAAIDGKGDGARSRYAVVDHFHSRARVGSSLFATAKDNKIPDYITSELTRVFSYDVDFQRQVKATDTFEVFYGNPLTGSSKNRKVLHYAKLTLGGQTKTYYRYTTADGQTDYYDENGQSAKKSLLKTPVSGARLTSGFGMRRHPILGYSKMHTGVDFGVPYGTPIRSAGSGVVQVAGRHGGYGIMVEVRHTGKYETLYAHMSRLAKGIRSGARINQGQIIGYVGSTGRSTGPHLHYEVRVNDRPVNPNRIKVAGGRQLAGREMQKFSTLKTRIAQMMKVAPSATQVAQAQ